MKDSEFKRLAHNVGDLKIATSGVAVCEGYKPDITLTDKSGKLRYILECEQKTDRKAFIGDLVKAEHLSQLEKARPTLLIVMREFDNTTVQQISYQLEMYAKWLRDQFKNGIHLSGVWLMSDAAYVDSVLAGEVIGDLRFMKRVTTAVHDQQAVAADGPKTGCG